MIETLQAAMRQPEISARNLKNRELHPAVIKLENPKNNLVTLKHRNNNPFAQIAELAWLLGGRNDMDFLAYYLPNAMSFSDDDITWRRAYGPIMFAKKIERSAMNNILAMPYNKLDFHEFRKFVEEACIWNKDNHEFVKNNSSEGQIIRHNQFSYCLSKLTQELTTRQAIIGLWNPNKDALMAGSKDYPCTNILHFLVRDGKLDLTVFMRSNDIIWGFSSVNVFIFTTMQLFMANCLNIPLGNYFHIADSLHIYEKMYERAEKILDFIKNGRYIDIYNCLPEQSFLTHGGIGSEIVKEKLAEIYREHDNFKYKKEYDISYKESRNFEDRPDFFENIRNVLKAARFFTEYKNAELKKNEAEPILNLIASNLNALTKLDWYVSTASYVLRNVDKLHRDFIRACLKEKTNQILELVKEKQGVESVERVGKTFGLEVL